MGFFTALSKYATSGDFFTTALLAGTMAYGANEASKANTRAAQITAQSADRQAAAIRDGNVRAQQRYQQIQDETAPGRDYMRRTVVSDPSQLSLYQQGQVDDARRETVRSLSASGLIGAGRTVAAGVKSVEGGLKARLIEQNRGRADTAASGLSNQYYNAARSAANVDQNTGVQVANVDRYGAEAAANSGLANARLTGSAIGDISSMISSDLKRRGRNSSYGNEETKKVGEG